MSQTEIEPSARTYQYVMAAVAVACMLFGLVSLVG